MGGRETEWRGGAQIAGIATWKHAHDNPLPGDNTE